jgi:hypothetical protein
MRLFASSESLKIFSSHTCKVSRLTSGIVAIEDFPKKQNIGITCYDNLSITQSGRLRVHSNSGLVRRCNKCKSILHDSCPNNCNEDWGWDLRVSSRLYDGSGSIKMILTKDIASKILQKSLSELVLLSSQPIPCTNASQFQASICSIKIPDTIEVIEAVSEYVSSYRKSGKLIVTD